MLDFRIKTFLSVCKYMNYTQASKELNITQPAVSQHIHFLEKEYNSKFFYQVGKKIFLTENGKIFYEKMNQINNDEQLLFRHLSNDNNKISSISFGVTMTIGEYIIANPVSKYISKHSDTNFKIHFGNTAELLKSLENGSIAFALVEGYFDVKKYDTLLFSSEEFIPVCCSTHIFDKKPEYLKDLFSERLLVREPGSGTRNILERMLSLGNYTTDDFAKFIQVENMHTIIQLLLKDCGISFLYKAAVIREIENKSLMPIQLKDFAIKHNFTFLWPKNSTFRHEIKDICQELIDYSR